MSQVQAQQGPAVGPETQSQVMAEYKNNVDEEERLLGDESDSHDDDYDQGQEDELNRTNKNFRLWRLFSTPIITVLVGQSEHPFYIHSGILCYHSSFFHHMLRSDHFPESKEKVVRFPEDDITSFAVFAEYIYVGSECDTGAILRDAERKDVNFGVVQPANLQSTSNEPNRVKQEEGSNDDEQSDVEMESEKDEDEEVEGEKVEGKQMGCTNNSANDKYDFMLQFSCYVLSDKLQAPGFKRLIMDEIRCHGEFCDPVSLTMEHVRYVYDHTVRQDDPLRRFCIMIKCKQMPIEETLADPEFVALMEDGGPLVKDVMQVCRKQTLKQNQRIKRHREEITKHEQEVTRWKQKIQQQRQQQQQQGLELQQLQQQQQQRQQRSRNSTGSGTGTATVQYGTSHRSR